MIFILPFVFSIFCNQDIPTLAQNTGLALITILIPIAVAQYSAEHDFQKLDTQVLLDYVIGAKRVLLSIILLFIPVFFWKTSPLLFRFLELSMWGVGVYLMIRTLIVSYYWLRGDKYPLRLDYLKSLTNVEDLREAWKDVWENKALDTVHESQFFKVFSETIAKLKLNV